MVLELIISKHQAHFSPASPQWQVCTDNGCYLYYSDRPISEIFIIVLGQLDKTVLLKGLQLLLASFLGSIFGAAYIACKTPN